MLIQYLLVAGVVIVLVSFLRNRNALRFQAGKKILFAVFLVACVVSIVRPSLLSTVADWVGVGRGADLLLYALIVAFAFVSINTYLKFKDYDERLTRLARQLAISEARLRVARGGDEEHL
ncbi:DUF2304 domain-containing protein [Motilibacter deserti]|uniref:DUF2304 domain-containing protein n=1 Tax=Motilibacter deserti TaxID=2714956 RepID=A0ABX0H3T1_9ACTN|nr:DUF2304 domain-containing protein [Motilibacter deserti]NHC16430.1 DUF2304 domain-containing protein [Motilibacter deserti]